MKTLLLQILLSTGNRKLGTVYSATGAPPPQPHPSTPPQPHPFHPSSSAPPLQPTHCVDHVAITAAVGFSWLALQASGAPLTGHLLNAVTTPAWVT